jgi:hypothetical protein
MLVGLLALVIAAAFAGATLCVNLAEQPARMRLPIGPLLTQMEAKLRTRLCDAGERCDSGYRVCRDRMVAKPPLALVGGRSRTACELAIQAARHRASEPRLMATEPKQADETHTRSDLRRWGQLHAVRSALGLFSTALLLAAALEP